MGWGSKSTSFCKIVFMLKIIIDYFFEFCFIEKVTHAIFTVTLRKILLLYLREWTAMYGSRSSARR